MVSAASMNTGKFNQSVEIRVFAGSADLANQNVVLFIGEAGVCTGCNFCVSPFPFPHGSKK